MWLVLLGFFFFSLYFFGPRCQLQSSICSYTVLGCLFFQATSGWWLFIYKNKREKSNVNEKTSWTTVFFFYYFDIVNYPKEDWTRAAPLIKPQRSLSRKLKLFTLARASALGCGFKKGSENIIFLCSIHRKNRLFHHGLFSLSCVLSLAWLASH